MCHLPLICPWESIAQNMFSQQCLTASVTGWMGRVPQQPVLRCLSGSSPWAEGIDGTTGVFQLTPRAGLTFHTPLIAFQCVEVGRNIERCFNESLGRGWREVCSLLCEHAGDARTCLSTPVAPFCCTKTDRKTGELKKWPRANVCLKSQNGVLHSSHSRCMKNTVLPWKAMESPYIWKLWELAVQWRASSPVTDCCQGRNFCSQCVFTCLHQRRHPATQPRFCVNLLALLVFICPLPSHYKELWRFVENHTTVVFSSPTCRTATTAWLSLRCLKPTTSHPLQKMSWLTWRLNLAFGLMRSESWGLPLKFFQFW